MITLKINKLDLQKLNKLRSNLLLRFILKALGIYLVWNLIYEKWIGPARSLDEAIIGNTTDIAGFLLEASRFDIFRSTNRLIGIDGSNGLWVGDSCNGLDLFVLFAGFIIAFPGKALFKMIFIPTGILIIHLINVLRIYSLAILQVYAPETVDFNHSYTFTFLVYGMIFLMWMFWVKRFSGLKKS